MPAYFISLREGLEAALIVGILLGTLRRLDQRGLARYLWLGVIAAAGVSLVVAVGLSAAGIEFEGLGEQLFEGVMFIAAAALLTGMIFWMQRRSGQLRSALEAGARRAAASAKSEGTKGVFPPGAWALFTVAFVAVVRGRGAGQRDHTPAARSTLDMRARSRRPSPAPRRAASGP